MRNIQLTPFTVSEIVSDMLNYELGRFLFYRGQIIDWRADGLKGLNSLMAESSDHLDTALIAKHTIPINVDDIKELYDLSPQYPVYNNQHEFIGVRENNKDHGLYEIRIPILTFNMKKLLESMRDELQKYPDYTIPIVLFDGSYVEHCIGGIDHTRIDRIHDGKHISPKNRSKYGFSTLRKIAPVDPYQSLADSYLLTEDYRSLYTWKIRVDRAEQPPRFEINVNSDNMLSPEVRNKDWIRKVHYFPKYRLFGWNIDQLYYSMIMELGLPNIPIVIASTFRQTHPYLVDAPCTSCYLKCPTISIINGGKKTKYCKECWPRTNINPDTCRICINDLTPEYNNRKSTSSWSRYIDALDNGEFTYVKDNDGHLYIIKDMCVIDNIKKLKTMTIPESCCDIYIAIGYFPNKITFAIPDNDIVN